MIEGLGSRLKEQRELHNLSQKEVAKRLNISFSVLSNYESGERTPSLEKLVRLANLYQCTTDYLLGFTREMTDNTLDVSMLTDKQVLSLSSFLSDLKE